MRSFSSPLFWLQIATIFSRTKDVLLKSTRYDRGKYANCYSFFSFLVYFFHRENSLPQNLRREIWSLSSESNQLWFASLKFSGFLRISSGFRPSNPETFLTKKLFKHTMKKRSREAMRENTLKLTCSRGYLLSTLSATSNRWNWRLHVISSAVDSSSAQFYETKGFFTFIKRLVCRNLIITAEFQGS